MAQHFGGEAQVETGANADKIEMPILSDLSSSASRLAELREQLRPYWIPGEAGGIALLTGLGLEDEENEGSNESKEFFKSLAARVPEVAQVVPDDERVAKLVRILVDDVSAFLAEGKLAPGPYQLDNYHLDYALHGKLIFNADGDPPIALPAERMFTFTVTEEHLKLLRHVHTRGFHGEIELMAMKRPYGNMTYYFYDMADALGEPLPDDTYFTPQQIERYLQLHREMLFAAQAFWCYAQ
jgi:hypothetical protein